MSPQVPPGWSLRLTELLGTALDEVEEGDLERLVVGGVREDADLDFKLESYGNTDQARRDLAGDIAAMANSRGGLIVVGIRDEDDAAVERTPVELVDGEEARIRQIAAGNIVPHVPFAVRVVSSANDAERGYYLVIVPPNTMRPHAVRKGRDLRYPRRDGTTTRWLSEPEVADAYRDRFAVAADQSGRVERVLQDGLAAMDLSEEAFIAVALVPTGAGSMPIDVARVAAIEQWASGLGPSRFFGAFFDAQSSPAAGVGARRITVTTVRERDRPANWHYAELYDDGTGFASIRLTDPRRRWQYAEREGIWIGNQDLLYKLARCLHLLGRHAAENCGAWGDALVEAQVVGKGGDLRLTYMDQFRHPEPIQGGRVHTGAVPSRHTVLVDAIASIGPSLLATTRLIATDHFHAFGSPEVRHLSADGRIRIKYFRDDLGPLQEWAEQYGISVTDETVPGE